MRDRINKINLFIILAITFGLVILLIPALSAAAGAGWALVSVGGGALAWREVAYRRERLATAPAPEFTFKSQSATLTWRVAEMNNQTIGPVDFLRLVVEFSQAGQLVHINDFYMQLSPNKATVTGPDPDVDYIIEAKTDGELAAEIRANVTAYIGRTAGTWPGFDNTNPALAGDGRDPLGLLARPGVAALVGAINDHP